QTLQSLAHFFAIGFGFRFNRHRNDWFRKSRRFEHDLEIFVTKGVTGSDVPDADQSSDIARERGFDIYALVGLNHQDSADALALARARVVDDIPFLELPTIDTEEYQFADVRICPELKRERAEFGVIVGMNFNLLVRIGDNTDRGGNIEWRRQIIHNRIDERLDASFLEGGTAEHWNQLEPAGQPANGRLELFRSDRLVLYDHFRDLVIFVGYCINQFRQCCLGGLFQLGGNICHRVLEPDLVIWIIDDGFLVNHVDDAIKDILFAKRQKDRVGISSELFAH